MAAIQNKCMFRATCSTKATTRNLQGIPRQPKGRRPNLLNHLFQMMWSFIQDEDVDDDVDDDGAFSNAIEQTTDDDDDVKIL